MESVLSLSVDQSVIEMTMVDCKINEVKGDPHNKVSWCLFKVENNSIKHVASGPLVNPQKSESEENHFLGLWWQKEYCLEEDVIYYAFYKSPSYFRYKDKKFTLLIWIPPSTRGMSYLQYVKEHKRHLTAAIGEESLLKTNVVIIEPSIGRRLWETSRVEREQWAKRKSELIQEASATRKIKTVDPDLRRKMLSGNVSDLPPLPKRDILTFLSSTFLDTRNERDVYWDDVHPYLVSLTRQLGMSYVTLDMRWGVKHIATDNHETLQLCLDNVEYCQKNSVGCSFVSILGQRCGYKPIPSSIEIHLFNELVTLIEQDAQKSSESKIGLENIKEWFRLDENCEPPRYVLQNISWKYGKYRKIPQEWWDTYDSMQEAFKKASYRLHERFSESAYMFQVSITEAEIRKGIFREESDIPSDFASKAFMFDIAITDINPQDEIAQTFAEVTKKNGSCELDTDALSSLKSLKTRIEQNVPKDHCTKFSRNWSSDGITVENNADYLREFADTFCEYMVKSTIEGIKTANITLDSIYSEALQHNTLWVKNCSEFVGGEPTLKTIKELVAGKQNEPIILHGPSGCGKTFFMSKASVMIAEEFEVSSCITLYLGTSPRTSSAHSVLDTLCHRLTSILSLETSTIPKKFDDLVEYLTKLLEKLTAMNGTVCLILDALDQLTDEDSGRDLKWLPDKLPSNVLLILSTIHEEDESLRLPHIEQCYEALRERNIPENHFIKIPELQKYDIISIVMHWLDKDKRKLTEHQLSTLVSATQNSPSPLYLKLAYAQTKQWHSYTPESETKIPGTISGILNAMFDALEQHHGKILVKHAFAYITATKHGLSINELQDILSCNEEVLNEVFEYFSPPIRRFPPHVWLSLRAALGHYLLERGAQGETVYGWYHRQFWETVQERYLNEQDYQRSLDKISSYFLCELEGTLPYVDKKSGFQVSVHRNVASQDLILFDGDRTRQQNPVYNLRKMVELPHALLGAKRKNDLEDLLCSIDFITAMFAVEMHHDLIDIMLEASKDLLVDSKRLAAFSQFVQANSVELSKHPFLVVQECHNDSDGSILHSAAVKVLNRQPRMNELARFEYLNKKQGEDPAMFSLKALYEASAHAQIYSVTLIGEDSGLAVAFGVTNIYVDYGTVRTFDSKNGKELATLVQGKKIGHGSLCCSHDGKYLAYQADDIIYFADVEDVAHPKKVFEHKIGSGSVQISSSKRGDFIMYQGGNSFEVIAQKSWTINGRIIDACGQNLVQVSYSDNGEYLCCVTISSGGEEVEDADEADEVVAERSVSTGKFEIDIIDAETLQKAGKTIVIGDIVKSYQDNMLRQEIDAEGEREGELIGQIIELCNSFAFARDGTMVALGFWNGTVHVFCLKSGKLITVLKRPENENDDKSLYDEEWNTNDIKFSPDGSLLFVTYGDDTFRVYNVESWEEEFMLPSFGNHCHVIDVSKDNNIAFVVNYGNHKIQRIDMPLLRISSEVNKERPGFTTRVWQNSNIRFSPNGKTVSMAVQGDIKIIAFDTGKLLMSHQFKNYGVVVAGENGTVILPKARKILLTEIGTELSPGKERCVLDIKEENKPIICSFLLKSHDIVLLQDNGTLSVFNGETGKELRTASQLFTSVSDIRCTIHASIGERIAVILHNQSVTLLDAISLEVVVSIAGYSSGSYGGTDSFCVSSCGRAISTRANGQGGRFALATASLSKTDVINNAVKSGYLAATAICAVNMRFVAAGWEGDINLFDLNTGMPINRLSEEQTQISTSKAMWFSPCGKYIVSIGGDGATLADGGHVRLWNSDNLQLLGLFNSESGTNMVCADVYWLTEDRGEKEDSNVVLKVACLDWVGNIYLLKVHDRLYENIKE